jgi:hypothetical protein
MFRRVGSTLSFSKRCKANAAAILEPSLLTAYNIA